MKSRILVLLVFLCVLLSSCAPGGLSSSKNPSLSPDVSLWAAEPLPETQKTLQESIRYITHGAGSIDGMAGSNSQEALEQAYAAGCRYVEIDFQFTADGELACIHDWYRQYTSAIPEDGVALTLEQFQNCKIYDRYTPLWLDSLAAFMTEHPDLYIITDIKDRNTEGAAKIASDWPELTERFLVQIYEGEEYDLVREAGFDHVIYTLYKLDWNSKTDTEALCQYAAGHPLLAYTFAAELCSLDGYLEGMMASGLPLYVHTVNGDADQAYYFHLGISAVYTDDLQ